MGPASLLRNFPEKRKPQIGTRCSCLRRYQVGHSATVSNILDMVRKEVFYTDVFWERITLQVNHVLMPKACRAGTLIIEATITSGNNNWGAIFQGSGETERCWNSFFFENLNTWWKTGQSKLLVGDLVCFVLGIVFVISKDPTNWEIEVNGCVFLPCYGMFCDVRNPSNLSNRLVGAGVRAFHHLWHTVDHSLATCTKCVMSLCIILLYFADAYCVVNIIKLYFGGTYCAVNPLWTS